MPTERKSLFRSISVSYTHLQEANCFSKEAFLELGPEVDEKFANIVSLDIIGAAIYKDFEQYSDAHFNLFNKSCLLYTSLSMLASISPENEVSQSKIITVYSNKGGIGKTTIAVNLAAELAKVTKDKVALVDLNLQLGDISTFLNLNPPFDVNYVIRRLIDKEENILIKGFEKYKDLSLYVLSDPSYIEQSESITTQQITTLFSALKKVFPYIVIDMSSSIDSISLKILDSSDWIMFTTIVNIPAIRNAQRCLNLFRSRKYPSNKVKIVINRYMENDEIKIEDIENTLGESVYWKIPNNYFTIMEAINKGVSISEVNAESNIGNSFRDFAAKVSDDIIEQSVVCLLYTSRCV